MTIPSKSLVGKNARVVNGEYIDDFIYALNNYAIVGEVFGKNQAKIAKGESDSVAMLVMDTLGHLEYEFHLAALVITAAKNNSWSAVIRERQHEPGLSEVVKKNFGYVVEYSGQKYLLPSVKYIDYCKEQK